MRLKRFSREAIGYEMDYPAFLEERRKRMAAIIQEGFAHLS